MSMKSKMFNRQAGKALKEKGQYYAKAKGMLETGNEEGARMYLELAQQKDAENKQFMRMAVRLETLRVKIGSLTNSVGMVDHLNDITPILDMQAQELPIEQMYGKLDRFNNAYDDMAIKGNILNDGMDKGVNFEMDPAQMQNQQQTQANNNYYDDLRNM